MNPGDSVRMVEQELRRIVRAILGNGEWTSAPGAPKIPPLEERQSEDSKRRNGAILSHDLLSYTELRHLTTLVMKNLEKFKPVFGEKERTKVFFGVLEDFRNPVSHSRELLPFERELLSGAAGQLRNQIALYRTRLEPSNSYYPVIESVVDNFGQQFTAQDSWVPENGSLRLDVGQALEITCTGWDSRGRRLRWFAAFGIGGPDFKILAEGCSDAGERDQGSFCELEFEVPEFSVGETTRIGIVMSAADAKYHRHRSYDERVFITYAINPPEM